MKKVNEKEQEKEKEKTKAKQRKEKKKRKERRFLPAMVGKFLGAVQPYHLL